MCVLSIGPTFKSMLWVKEIVIQQEVNNRNRSIFRQININYTQYELQMNRPTRDYFRAINPQTPGTPKYFAYLELC